MQGNGALDMNHCNEILPVSGYLRSAGGGGKIGKFGEMCSYWKKVGRLHIIGGWGGYD